jgi:enoyl-CoA hydratase/carnithine racemase
MGLPEAKIGMGANFASVVLPKRIPTGIALEWLLTGEYVTSEEAARWGLVNRITDDVLPAALELAERIAANGPLALVATKEISNGGGDWTPAERWDQAAKLMQPVFTSEDAREGAQAFAEKRAPVWKGR